MLKTSYSKKELYRCGPQPPYSGRNLDEIAFPLGGIGTGSISLGGWGQLRDWEIMNRSAKGFGIQMAFFSLKVQFSDGSSVTKVLQGPVEGSYAAWHWMDGRKAHVGTLPRFQNVSFTGNFPIAKVFLSDPDLPLNVTLEAFNPFIPLNDKDSSIPVAIFFYHVKNIGDENVSVNIFGNLTNIIGQQESKGDINEIREGVNVKGLYLSTSKIDEGSPLYGSMVLATTWPNSTVWPRWKEDRSRGLGEFWETITLSDDFPPEPGESSTGTVAANFTLEPDEEATIPFIISWYFPMVERRERRRPFQKEKDEAYSTWRNYYAKNWKNAWDVILYVSSNLDRLWGETKIFKDTLFSSTLPVHILDAVSSQISILNTNTCLRLEDGTFYGFEGCSNTGGCCEGSCTHVWNYAQSLPYLFPNLQRSMLNAHFANSVREDGHMTFRMPLPLGTKASHDFEPAADGQMGMVIQVYREWLMCGDDEWLKHIWPITKKILEFSWKYWDINKDGIMEGVQHNTYDIEFWGPNTMTGSLYLGALRAAEELAHYLGEEEKASEYNELFKKGSRWADENLFNDQYYEQKVNQTANDTQPKPQRQHSIRRGKDDKFKEWPKEQFGKGCLSDQMIGQWYSHMLGLEYLYNPQNVHKALNSIFKYNWKQKLSNYPCTHRIYALNDEAGLLLCTWPIGEKPGNPFHFNDEVWCGIEYQVASHMIYEGLIDEALSIVMGTRMRHRGDRRNPWNEFECGWHYSRSMASYGLLLALSGYRYSAIEKKLGFSPKIFTKNFKSFFSTTKGWGSYSQKISQNRADFTLDLRYGSLILDTLELPSVNIKDPKVEANHSGNKIDVKFEIRNGKIKITLDSLSLKCDQTLKVSIYK